MLRLLILLALSADLSAASQPSELMSLNHVAPPKSLDGQLVADVRDFILARSATEGQEQKAWGQAARSAQGPLGRLVLTEWATFLAQKNSPKQVVEEILKITRNGSASPYILSKRLTSSNKLSSFLSKQGVFSEHKVVKKVPAVLSDPSLHKAATLWCQSRGETKKMWSNWQRDLSGEQQEYWSLLQGRCDSIEGFEQKMRGFSTRKDLSPSMRLVVLRRLAVTQRQLGKRSEVWKTYDQLLAAWGYVQPKKPKELIQRIDDHLWAARYQSFVGQYDRANQIVLQSEVYLRNAKKKMNTSRRKKKLRDLRAEALHIRSFRIAVGKHQYLQGAKLISQSWNDLPQSWKQRFQWYEGLLYYVGGKPEKALESWKLLVDVIRSQKMRPKILFWVARVSNQLKFHEQAEHYKKLLAEESPFSFYNVVGLREAGISESILPPAVMPLRESKQGVAVLQKHKWVGPMWKKSQILLQAGLIDIAQPFIKECDRRIRKRFGVGRFMEQYVHLSRLHYRGGNFRHAIALNADLSGVRKGYWEKWPDQVSVFFPRPFFHRWAQSNVDARSVSTSTLLAIARQESAFDARAVSPANAFGLMQLTLSTARGLSNSKLQDHELAEQLLEPDRNIQLGAIYVEQLKKRYNHWAHVFAAYNAGELAVDTWLKHRSHHDILTWLELIPFGETRKYAMAVWRNQEVYQKHLPQLSSDKKEVKKVRGARARIERPLRERNL